MEFGIILLAAGASSRMGGEHKLLLPWGDGTVVGQALRNAAQAPVEHLIAVLGYRAEEVRRAAGECGRPVGWVVNPRWEEGMFTSIQAGLAELPPAVEAFFVVLGDMPLIPLAVYADLIAAFRPRMVCVPTHQGRRGHPVLVSRDLADGAEAPAGDQGLRSVLRRYPERVIEVPVEHPGVCIDLDTPEEYQQHKPR